MDTVLTVILTLVAVCLVIAGVLDVAVWFEKRQIAHPRRHA